MKSCSVFHIEQKLEFEKFNCFFVDFFRPSFARIKVISTVVEREYTPGITRHICFSYHYLRSLLIKRNRSRSENSSPNTFLGQK